MTTTNASHEIDTHEDEFVDEIWNLAGGEDAYLNMITWVNYTLPSEEKEEYNTKMESDDTEVVKSTVLDLFTKFKAACDQDPNLEADMDARRRMRAAQNQYSDEVVDIFKHINTHPLNAQDCHQLARVLSSMAAKKYEDYLDEQLEDDDTSKWMTKYLTANFTLCLSAKNDLWCAQLPHEVVADEEEEQEEEEG